jgi:hypothetical protein
MNKYTALIFTLVTITSAHAMHKERLRRDWQQKYEFQQLRSRKYQGSHNMSRRQTPKVSPQEAPDIKNSLNSDTINDQRQLPNT